MARVLGIIGVALAAALCGCGRDSITSNCDHPIAAVYTEQCNPYLSRPGHD
jgi:hypothetical protein